MKTVLVHVQWVHWMDENDEEISEPMRVKLGLPDEEDVELDAEDGDWSEAGLEKQCTDALELKYRDTKMKVSYFTIDYPGY